MLITRLHLKNWRNFKQIDVPLRERVFVIGPNASGKSNLLDALRFLRDVAQPKGGGLQRAVEKRGGLTKLRCLLARRDPEVLIEVELAERAGGPACWCYALGFKSEGKGAQRVVVSEERVEDLRAGTVSLQRPDAQDQSDQERLTETHLERIAKTAEKTRTSRLKKIEAALKVCVPNMKNLEFRRDEVTGTPHLHALYEHWRPKAGSQREDEFSDGTLRLLGLMWSLLDGDSLLLLEEPELSLNEAIVRQIPPLLWSVQSQAKHRRQVFITTHSQALLEHSSVDPQDVLRLEPTSDGTKVITASKAEVELVKAGYTVAEAIGSKVAPVQLNQLSLL